MSSCRRVLQHVSILETTNKINLITYRIILFNNKLHSNIMNSTIEILHMQTLREIFGFDLKTTLCISTAIVIILALGTTIQKQLYSFLKTKNKRLVNRIILPNVLLQNITYPIILCYILLAIWVQDPRYYISDYGCYGFSIILQFSGLFDRSVSFFVNLFRYICIVHDESLKKYDIHPKVSLF